MRVYQINGLSAKVLIGLSFAALLVVLTGYTQPPQPDEGTGAHIFQLLILAVVPTIVVFFATADWKQPSRGMRALLLPSVFLILAFGALYYLEHYR